MSQLLNLPSYDHRLSTDGTNTLIFDEIRRQWVRLTPEEWVRQHFLHFLVNQRGVPTGLLAVEKEFTFHGMSRRADIVAFDNRAKSVLVVECKAPSVRLQQSAFDQLALYNTVMSAPYLVVTNGVAHFCYRVPSDGDEFEFLVEIPHYKELTASADQQ